MNLNHLTDRELVQWIIKHDTDPVRVRLAKYMERMPGRILDGLERAGMDPETCLHDNLHESGEYIEHLKNEIEYLSNELEETQAKLRDRETLTVSGLIEELKDIARAAERRARIATEQAQAADQEREQIKSKMKVWSAISQDVSR